MEQLTKREEEVMNKFWEKGEATVKELIATYPEPRPTDRKQRIHLFSPYRKR